MLFFPNYVFKILFSISISYLLIVSKKRFRTIAWANEISTKKEEFIFYFILLLTHIFLVYWMWQSHAFHSLIVSLFPLSVICLPEELLFLLLLPVSRKWVIYDFTCVKDAVSLFKKNNKPKTQNVCNFTTKKIYFFDSLKL